MVKIKNVSFFRQGVPLLRSVSWDLKAGVVYGLVAPNGAGKSSLVKALIGYPEYTVDGSIEFNGIDIATRSLYERARLGMLLVFQHSPEIPGLSCFRFLKEAYHAMHGYKSVIDLKKIIDAACTVVGLNPEYMSRDLYVGFSGGERKRFDLVQALVLNPRVVMFDEVDSGMDDAGVSAIVKVIARLREQRPEIIIILISHNQSLLAQIPGIELKTIISGTIAPLNFREMA